MNVAFNQIVIYLFEELYSIRNYLLSKCINQLN